MCTMAIIVIMPFAGPSKRHNQGNEQHKILAPTAVYARPGGNVPLSCGGKPDVGNVCRFSDVAEDSFCRSAVIGAVANNITNGKTETTFAPSEICNRAQIVTVPVQIL